MAEARAKLNPSTVISTVAPRETPCGDTELMVGGVMRLPVGESAICWANTEVAMEAKTRIDLISALCKTKQRGARTFACRVETLLDARCAQCRSFMARHRASRRV